MATDDAKGEKLIVTVPVQRGWGRLLLTLPVAVALAVSGLVSWGLVAVLVVVGGLLLLPLVGYVVRYVVAGPSGPRRLVLDETGASYESLRAGSWLRGAPLFLWDQVSKVKTLPLGEEHLEVQLGRGKSFWKRSGPVRLPKAVWQQPGVIEKIGQHVPPERISLARLRPERRRRRFAVGAVVFLALAAALTGHLVYLAASPDASVVAYSWLLLVSFLVGLFALAYAYPPSSVAVEAMTGAFLALLWLHTVWFLLGWIGIAHRLMVTSGAGMAGVFLGGAVLALLRDRLRPYHLGIFYALAVLGGLVGWVCSGGLPSLRLGEGSILCTGWTPDGSGFVAEVKNDVPKETVLQWYTADGLPGHRVTVPEGKSRGVGAVGQEAALYLVKQEDRRDVYVIPRHRGEARSLLLDCQLHSGPRVSPNGRLAALATKAGPEERPLLYWLELPEGEPVEVELPPEMKDVHHIGILDTGELVWTTGKRLRAADGDRLTYESDVPPRDLWPSADERVDVWRWNPDSGVPPTKVYDAEHVWLDWRMTRTSDRLLVCRVIDAGEPAKEFVEIVLTAQPPEVRPIRRERLDRFEPISADGRFVLETVEWSLKEKHSLDVAILRDTVSGKARRLGVPGMAPLAFARWSPKDNRFVYGAIDVGLFKFVWKRNLKDPDEWDEREVLYLFDLER